MKKSLYILFAAGAAILFTLTSCEPKFEYKTYSYVIMDETSVSVAEDAYSLTLKVKAYPQDGVPNTEVEFEVVDGEGDNGAKNGIDYTLVSPVNGLLIFAGDSTATIEFRISDANVGIYTGRKNFSVRLTEASNGYTIGGAHATSVSITDVDKNLDDVGITGTYMAEGYGRVSGGYDDATWEMHIVEHPTNSDIYYVYGLTPYAGGLDIASAGEEYWAIGYYGDDDDTFIIPSQVCTGMVNSSSGATYYLGYTPCTQYSDGSWYYSPQYPPMTFHKTGDDVWESDYGVFVAGCTDYDISTFTSYFGVVAPTVKITRFE